MKGLLKKIGKLAAGAATGGILGAGLALWNYFAQTGVAP